ncbi:hypothetical protein ASPVEDRAFT_148061 [Aspergillus versicolor CBS 583.65]|uniref:DUF7587 domain-containing protein n=1 Tax=Aspergillus versicolor CBS 583.65 TaxID=1036611 RepID=A0A1L9PBL7_ASPVE|nr:uncharacterized protein ASPVEDRAFT_148061 [Aspergillus versicolor CBS 583.65]OJI98896.1 hypothetical protein ASPVEDRAFT_148061 [Aspergillus versicolor CBS 583.65]
MDTFRLAPGDLPHTLYRVQYSETMTTEGYDGSLIAQDTTTIYNEEETLSEAAERHLNWDHKYTSIFISTFSDRGRAYSWMLERKSRFDNSECGLLTIETAVLGPGADVFSAEELVDVLRLDIIDRAKGSIVGQYLVAYRISPDAVREYVSLDKTRQDCPPLPFTREDVIPDGLAEYLESLE